MYNLRNNCDNYIIDRATTTNNFYNNLDSFREYVDDWQI